ncbi:MAG TPA: LPS export ABC transporter periplasmic protein LptC [Methylomirabilota bacterium]|jgi:LPS export ABC transporter protein LptC|nr:LPS export ABC transporter periplasmic protein LptC [Methylomirabilota bacterium]
MHKLARGILVVVAAFVLLLTGTLVIRSRSASIESLGPSPSAADLRIKEVDLEEVTKGVRWRLRAEQALMFEQEGRTSLRRLTVRVFEKDRSWTVVGDEGDIDQKSKNVEVRKNVVITSDDGLRLDTSVIRWDAERARLWTDAPVVFEREGSIVKGTGMEMTTQDETTTVEGRVHAIFSKRSTR